MYTYIHKFLCLEISTQYTLILGKLAGPDKTALQ